MSDQSIKGYRGLTERDLALINECKEMGVRVGELCDKLDGLTDINAVNARWLAIGKTDLQKGFMALVRSIAQPETF